MRMKTFSLVIPCYNEAASLPELFKRCAAAVTRSDVEIVFVDNGSSDATPQLMPQLVAAHPFARSIRVEVNQGYGFGILSGLEAAEGKFLGWTHADLQTDPADAIRGLEILMAQADPERAFVKGRRWGRPISDVVFTLGMSVFEFLILGKLLVDINAQPTIFSRSFFKGWRNAPHDFSLDLFAFYQAKQQRLTTKRFPVYFGKRQHGVSHWNINWQAKLKFIKRTMDFSFKLRSRLQEARGA